MKKPEKFKQNDPKDQLQAILGAIRGNICNAESDLINKEDLINRLNPLLDDLDLLKDFMSKEW